MGYFFLTINSIIASKEAETDNTVITTSVYGFTDSYVCKRANISPTIRSERINSNLSKFTFYLLLNLVSICLRSALISSISDCISSLTFLAMILDKEENITKKLQAIPIVAIIIKYKLIRYILDRKSVV